MEVTMHRLLLVILTILTSCSEQSSLYISVKAPSGLGLFVYTHDPRINRMAEIQKYAIQLVTVKENMVL
ncbi:hypothetical protein BDV26DRAFT_139017 [Aspergillus bertholletiae]|uniref:Uncharacterized protein n=1 Tax=Aspergillus bertholletiae TaxID=1226010 RepID=A0A5N7BNL0_9EURO|nr:hypothetical protein BDV26DRAFT_139017 [Aspergillus bertholletiae]